MFFTFYKNEVKPTVIVKPIENVKENSWTWVIIKNKEKLEKNIDNWMYSWEKSLIDLLWDIKKKDFLRSKTDNKELKKIIETKTILDVIDYLFNKKTYNNWEISIIKEYFKKNNISNNIVQCKKENCELKEKIEILSQLIMIKNKIEEKKEENNKYIKNINNYKDLFTLKKYLNWKYICSEKDVIENYKRKIKLTKLSPENELIDKRLKVFKELSNLSFDFMKDIQNIDLLLTEPTKFSFTLKKLLDIKKSKIISKKIYFWENVSENEYYFYKNLYFEKTTINNLSSYLKSNYYKVTKNKKYEYIFVTSYINTKEGKIKIAIPELLLLENKDLNNTIIYLYLSTIENNCNFTNVKFSNYEKDINNNELINNILKEYSNLNIKLTQGKLTIEELYYLKFIKLLLNEILINK